MIEPDLREGAELHGFSVRRVTPLAELNATLFELEHGRTGARYLHLANADDNNLFAVGFRTPPRDSTGAPHILEHTALCGSRRYPVHDPFFSMLKRSLSTFMNALTADDWTLYPFSSQNRTDFYNLMGIYLDAAFFPLLRERDFRQEGHRLELAEPKDPNSPLVIKGIVYNEMKGAMSDPYSLLETRLAEALYPTTAYGKNSGGEPRHIPELSWEALRAFHATCYHPSNAYFFSYGDLLLEPHLRFVEDQVLGQFERIALNTSVGEEIRFTGPRRLTVGYPLDPGEPAEKKAMVQVGWLTCNIAADLDREALGLLSTLLLGDPAAPLHRALLESKLGANLAPGTGFNGEHRETSFAAGLQGTDPAGGGAVEDLILSTLAKSAKKGFAKDRIEAAIHQLEFAHKEVRGDHYPYGLSLLMRVMGPWIHGCDPARPLLLGEQLERLRAEISAGPFFEELIRRWLLDNPHRVTLTLAPDSALQAREEAESSNRLAELRTRLTAAEGQALLDKAQELAEAQEAEEDLSCLPTLELSDIPREGRRVPSLLTTESGEPVRWFDQPTNGLGYFVAHLDTRGLPPELVPYVPVFCGVWGQMGAAGQSYTELAERIAAATGGIRAGVELLEHPERIGDFRALAEVEGKALDRNQKKLFGILRDLFVEPDFSDRDRLHTVLNQLRTNLENSIPTMGHRYAARAAAAGLTPAARLRERWSGVEHIRFVRRIADLGAGELGEVAGRLAEIAGHLRKPERVRCAVAGEERSFPAIRGALAGLLEGLRGSQRERRPGSSEAPESGEPPEQRLGLIASVPVSYVAQVFLCAPFTHPDAPGLLVLAKLLRGDYLHREIREKGGAYGGMAAYAPEAGIFSLLSYRDPHLVRTLTVYEEAARWAAARNFAESELKEAILGVVGDLDRPLSPAGKATAEFSNIEQGLTWDMRQRLREGVLGCGRNHLADLADRYLVGGRERSAVAVVAGEEALNKANQELGEAPLALRRI